jgi:hypothetical protein
MSRIRSYIMAGALAFATVVPVTMAEAGPMAPAPIKVEKSSDVTQVRCGRWGCRGRYWNGRGRYYGRGRYWGPRYYGARRYWGPRRVWVAPVIIAPRVVVRRGYNAHVNWCLNRYGSYNPRTNTFLSYDGYYKRCVSPY